MAETAKQETGEESPNPESTNRGLKKTREGIVVQNKMDKSVVVSVMSYKKHAQYGKYIRRTKKYMAHDETNTCGVGDRVLIVESRPLSKRKRWRVRSVVQRAE